LSTSSLTSLVNHKFTALVRSLFPRTTRFFLKILFILSCTYKMNHFLNVITSSVITSISSFQRSSLILKTNNVFPLFLFKIVFQKILCKFSEN
jgi:hypothetical protein